MRGRVRRPVRKQVPTHPEQSGFAPGGNLSDARLFTSRGWPYRRPA
jgi:hypothetical protein